MKGFRFRLDPVLAHRERVERERAGEHARRLADQLAAEADRDDLIARRDRARRSLLEDHGSLDGDRLRFTYAHLEYLDRAIISAQQRVDACAVETGHAHAALVAAAKDRKVLETLKERRKEAFQYETALAEQRELDDLNARLFDRAHPLEELPS